MGSFQRHHCFSWSYHGNLKEKPELIQVLSNPFSLTEGFEESRQLDDSKVLLDEKLNMWVAPFVMAPINTKNIHRSNALLGQSEDFCYTISARVENKSLML